MRHVEAEPEYRADPAALGAPFGEFLLQQLPRDAVVFQRHAGFAVCPRFRCGDTEIEEFRRGVLLLEVLHRHAPFRGCDEPSVVFLKDLLLVARGDIHLENAQLVRTKVIFPRHIGRHALALPAADGSAPRIVNDRNAVRFPVFIHALDAFIRRHHTDSSLGVSYVVVRMACATVSDGHSIQQVDAFSNETFLSIRERL